MSFGLFIKSSIAVSLIGVIVTFFMGDVGFFNFDDRKGFARLSNVLNGLLKLETGSLVGDGVGRPRVAVGYGACRDVFVNARDLLRKSKFTSTPEHYNEIQNDQQLLKSFAYYFQHGAAAERFVSDADLFQKWVRKASNLDNARWALGGNAPVMATRLYNEGCDVLLAAKMTKELKENLPAGLKITSGADINQDDIHLIIEYDINEVWNGIKTPRANRYIIHNDQNNPMVSSLETLSEMLPKFAPDVLIVSGLQMMDNYPFAKGIREYRLEAIRNQMIFQGKQSRVHFEMASFVEEKLLKDLTTMIIPFSDSIGMNEQELTNLHNLYLYGDVTTVVDSNPRVAQVLDEMRKLYQLIHDSSKEIENAKKLTRIHVHTLAYQVILIDQNSNWRRSKAAAAKAALVANRHTCGSKIINLEKGRLILDNSFAVSTASGSKRMVMGDNDPVVCWDEKIDFSNGKISDVHICLAPVVVCTEVKQTAGCGDNISSAGLVLQI